MWVLILCGTAWADPFVPDSPTQLVQDGKAPRELLTINPKPGRTQVREATAWHQHDFSSSDWSTIDLWILPGRRHQIAVYGSQFSWDQPTQGVPSPGFAEHLNAAYSLIDMSAELTANGRLAALDINAGEADYAHGLSRYWPQFPTVPVGVGAEWITGGRMYQRDEARPGTT